MKTKIFVFILVLLSCDMHAQKNIAIAEQIGGVFIFNDCNPIGRYEVLGDVSFGSKQPSSFYYIPNGTGGTTMIVSGGSTPQYTSIRNGLVSNAIMANRAVEGVIIQITKEGEGRATMIKFIEGENKALCQVNRQEGLYVFCDCTPVQGYDKLGEIVGAGGMSTMYGDIRNRLIKKVLHKKKFNTADGVILHLVEGGHDRAEAIQLQ